MLQEIQKKHQPLEDKDWPRRGFCRIILDTILPQQGAGHRVWHPAVLSQQLPRAAGFTFRGIPAKTANWEAQHRLTLGQLCLGGLAGAEGSNQRSLPPSSILWYFEEDQYIFDKYNTTEMWIHEIRPWFWNQPPEWWQMNLQSHPGYSQVKGCSWTWLKHCKEALEGRTEDLWEKQAEEAAYRTQWEFFPPWRFSVSCLAPSGTLLRHPTLSEPCTFRSSCSPSTCLPISAVISWHCSSLGSPVLPGQWVLLTWQHITTITLSALRPVKSSVLTSPINFLLHPSLAYLVFTKTSCHYLFMVINFTTVAKHSHNFNFSFSKLAGKYLKSETFR